MGGGVARGASLFRSVLKWSLLTSLTWYLVVCAAESEGLISQTSRRRRYSVHPYNYRQDKFAAFYAEIRKYSDKFYAYYRMNPHIRSSAGSATSHYYNKRHFIQVSNKCEKFMY